MTRTIAVIAIALLAACSRGSDTAETKPSEPAAIAPVDSVAQPTPLPADSAGAPAAPAETPAAGAPGATSPRGPAAAPAQQPTTTPDAQPAATDSATRILNRAAERYAQLQSLQAEFSMQYDNPLLKARTSGAGTMYQKKPDRVLLRFSEPAGDIVLSDGQYYWLYYPSVQKDQVVRSAAAESGASGVDLHAQFLGDPVRRFTYQLHGRENVGGRSAWLFTLTPKERVGYRRMRVWIDAQDHLARRFEITEDNGATRLFELRNVRLNPALRDALFTFAPPPGVRVITR